MNLLDDPSTRIILFPCKWALMKHHLSGGLSVNYKLHSGNKVATDESASEARQ